VCSGLQLYARRGVHFYALVRSNQEEAVRVVASAIKFRAGRNDFDLDWTARRCVLEIHILTASDVTIKSETYDDGPSTFLIDDGNETTSSPMLVITKSPRVVPSGCSGPLKSSVQAESADLRSGPGFVSWKWPTPSWRAETTVSSIY